MMPTRSGRLVCWREAEDSDRRAAIVEQAEVLASQAGDESAFLVRDGEDEVNFVDLHLDGRDGLVARRRLRGRGLLRSRGRLLNRCRSGLRLELEPAEPVPESCGAVALGADGRFVVEDEGAEVCAHRGAAIDADRKGENSQKPGGCGSFVSVAVTSIILPKSVR